MAAALGIGIIGTGRMAATMAASLARAPGLKPVAVASGDPARARAFAAAFGLAAAEGPGALAARADVDAVYVASRPARHAADARAALAEGKPVLVEKPFARTEAEAAAAFAAGPAMENLWPLALPAWAALKAAAAGGALGRPRHLAFTFGAPVARAAAPGLFDPLDGGALADRGVYGLAAALWLLGPVRRLTAALRREGGVDVAAALQLEHEGGATAQIAVALDAGLENALTLGLSRGLLRLPAPALLAERLETLALAEGAAMAADGRLKAWLKTRPLLRRLHRLRGGPRASPHPFGADPYQPVLAAFAAMVRSGARESPAIPAALTLEALRLAEAARAGGDG